MSTPQLPSVQKTTLPGRLALLLLAACLLASPSFAGPSETSGAMTVNGEEVQLPFVYMWKLDEGFYDPGDPTWTLLFVDRELAPKELGGMVWDAAFVEIGITETSEFGEQPELRAYSQSIRFTPDQGGNVSGGDYPSIELSFDDAGRAKGRVFHTEDQEFFDDTYRYDFTFDVALADPNAPVGDPLPAGGGEPGKAYLAWVDAVHSGELARLKAIVPKEMADQLDAASAEEVQEQMEFMQVMTPTEVEITSGSLDGETAYLQITGTMAGEPVSGEITMTKMGDHWMPTKSSM